MKKMIFGLSILGACYVAAVALIPRLEQKAVENFVDENPEVAAKLAAGPNAADLIDYDSDIIKTYEAYFGINPYGTRTRRNNVLFHSTEEIRDKYLLSLVIRRPEQYLYDSLNAEPTHVQDRAGIKEIVFVRNTDTQFFKESRNITLFVVGDVVQGGRVEVRYENDMDPRTEFMSEVMKMRNAVGEPYFQRNEGVSAYGGLDKGAQEMWITSEGDIMVFERNTRLFRQVFASSVLAGQAGLERLGL